MKKLEATSPSTARLEANARALLPPQDATLAATLFGELQRYRDSRRDAGATRTAAIVEGIEAAYYAHRPHLESIPLKNRTSVLLNKLATDLSLLEKLGTCGYDLYLEKLPCRDTAKAVVDRLASK